MVTQISCNQLIKFTEFPIQQDRESTFVLQVGLPAGSSLELPNPDVLDSKLLCTTIAYSTLFPFRLIKWVPGTPGTWWLKINSLLEVTQQLWGSWTPSIVFFFKFYKIDFFSTGCNLHKRHLFVISDKQLFLQKQFLFHSLWRLFLIKSNLIPCMALQPWDSWILSIKGGHRAFFQL